MQSLGPLTSLYENFNAYYPNKIDIYVYISANNHINKYNTRLTGTKHVNVS